jgi:DNA mismatch repair protein MutS2
MERIHQITNNENLDQLELPLVLKKLKEFIRSPYGHPHLENLSLLFDKSEIENRLIEVSEMIGLMEGGYSIPISDLTDIRPELDKLQPEDAFLESNILNQVKINLKTLHDVVLFLSKNKTNCPHLIKYAECIHPHDNIVKEIETTIDPSGEIREDASQELKRIRKEIFHLENDQRKILMRVVKKYSEFSQDDIITLRDGRIVLGIQQQYVKRINGIVHGISSTGATAFIEPMETLQISNQIQNLRIDEKKEIIRILRFLSGLVREVRMDILFSLENYGILDLVYAKAQLSKLIGGTAPVISDVPRLALKNARHPILILKIGYKNVVPCSLTLGEENLAIVITGPNAGGKTVALKTVGLLTIMVQIGLHIPVNPDSVIPIFDQVLVDIGDRQDLEQDLSTFSAHIIRLRDILDRANSSSLVLIDEIGTGTDPREGAALAISYIKEILECNALSITTTHHGELKAFAFTEKGIENASMEFNLESLKPTYNLRVGIPGSSYAFEIARRYGINEKVLRGAEKIIGPQKGKLEELIVNLNRQLQQAEKERRDLKIRLSEMEGLRNLYQSQLDQLKNEKMDHKRKAAEEAKQIVDDVNVEIEKIIAEIRRTQAQKESIKEGRKKIETLQKSIEKTLEETHVQADQSVDLHKDDVVWIDNLHEEGELLSEPGVDRKAWVLVDNVRLYLTVDGMKKIKKYRNKSSVSFKKSGEISDELQQGILPELDLRGMDSYEAIETTKRYLGQALQEGWAEVRIIHGKGTGVLRKKITEYLSKDKRIEEKRLGKWGEGDTGVTMVKLKKS